MTLMRNPNTTAYLCWFDDCETIEDAWQCEAESAADAATQYWDHVGLLREAVIRVGDGQSSEKWLISTATATRLG